MTDKLTKLGLRGKSGIGTESDDDDGKNEVKIALF